MHAIFSVGAPGSGKSTFMQPLARKLGYTYINPDAIRQEFTGDPRDHTREGAVWTTIHRRMVAGLQNNGIVFDATNAKRKDRRAMIRFCREHGAQTITGYYFAISRETSKQRNRQRDRQTPDHAIDRMTDFLTEHPPTLEDGFDELHVITEQDQAALGTAD